MGKKLYVGNLSYSLDSEGLQNLFTQYGNVESANVITDRDSGRSKGFGFVEMSTDEEANAAIEKLNGSEIEGRKVTVSEAKPQAPRTNRAGGGFSRDNNRPSGGGFGRNRY
ncbi:MAG: RNA-binding protein [Pseudomonadota bacterium]|nr:RNA-binding protein [Pseudomonadota bacterium]